MVGTCWLFFSRRVTQILHGRVPSWDDKVCVIETKKKKKKIENDKRKPKQEKKNLCLLLPKGSLIL